MPTLERIECKGLPQLKKLLGKWIAVQKKYNAQFKMEDWAWAYGERACVGFLAAAVWQCGGVALEEFGTEKMEGHGRGDLFFELSREQFQIEAKHMSIRMRVPVKKGTIADITDRLNGVTIDSRYGKKEYHRLGITFIKPYFPKKCGDAPCFKEWVDSLLPSIRPSACAIAYVFDPALAESQRKSHDKDIKEIQPGIVLLVKQLRSRRPRQFLQIRPHRLVARVVGEDLRVGFHAPRPTRGRCCGVLSRARPGFTARAE